MSGSKLWMMSEIQSRNGSQSFLRGAWNEMDKCTAKDRGPLLPSAVESSAQTDEKEVKSGFWRQHLTCSFQITWVTRWYPKEIRSRFSFSFFLCFFLSFLFFLLSLSFFHGHTCSIWKFLGQSLNPNCRNAISFNPVCQAEDRTCASAVIWAAAISSQPTVPWQELLYLF